MESIEELKYEYNFTQDDAARLRELEPFARKYVDDFIDAVYVQILSLKEAERFLSSESVRERHKRKFKDWFLMLFSGKYDASYLGKIYRTGEVHVKIGLPPHLLHATMNFIKNYLYDRLTQEFGCSKNRDLYFKSLQKILDLNLDIMVSSYREEELKLYLASMPVQRRIIEGIRKMLYGIDFFVVISLLLAAVFTIYFILEEMEMVVTRALEIDQGALSILGSTLILYAISELLSAEIKKIRGGRISLKVFVGVALAAIIRKVLIVSLSPEKANQLLVLGLMLICLGFVYFIIYKTEG